MNYQLQRRAQKPRNEARAVDYIIILKIRLRAYAVSLPGYAYAVLTNDRSIDDSAHLFELAISRYLSYHTFHLVSRDAPLIDLLLLLPTCLLFNASFIKFDEVRILLNFLVICSYGPGRFDV